MLFYNWDDFFFSYWTDFRYFLMKSFSESDQNIDTFEMGCRCCQLFFYWFSVILFYNHPRYIEGSSCWWSYGSWIYNYLCKLVRITTKVESSNPTHGKVYSIQDYVIMFVSDLQQVGGFLWVLWFPPPMKLSTTIELKYCWKWH